MVNKIRNQSLPNWRTAIPGAPMDLLSWTTSSVITPFHKPQTKILQWAP